LEQANEVGPGPESRPAKAIAVVSGKGGTGKTIVAANIGTALAMMGRKVVVVDGDLGMGDLGLYLGLEKSPVTLHEVLAGEASIDQAIYEGPAGCKIVPSGLSLSGYARANPDRLRDVVKELSGRFEFVILDCGPGLSKENTIPLALVDEVMLVVNPDLICLADALRVRMMCDAIGARVGGVVVNRAGMSKAELAPREVGSMLGLDVLAVIPEDDEIRKSASLKVPLVMKKKESPAAAAHFSLAQRIAGRPGEKAPRQEAAAPNEQKKGSRRFSIFGK